MHSLDHPDYVLMLLSDSSVSTPVQHAYGGFNRSVFAKISLYPLFREERMLPRDSTLSGSSLSRFTVRFVNPDMVTPYKFHGVDFSMSFNLFVPLGEGGS